MKEARETASCADHLRVCIECFSALNLSLLNSEEATLGVSKPNWDEAMRKQDTMYGVACRVGIADA